MNELLLLGRPSLHWRGRPIALTVRKSWALLVLLAVAGATSRARATSLLWPALDESSARRNLRRELARLNEAGAAGVVHAEGDFLALDPALDTDLRRFESAHANKRCDDALALWRGTLADGLLLDDAAAYDDWLAPQRERLHACWRQVLEAAAAAAPAEQAALHLQTLLADDPLHERHHRALMQLHLDAGRREAALAQYERCRRLLASELGLAPMRETERLIAGAIAAPTPVPSAAAAQGTETARSTTATTPSSPMSMQPATAPARPPPAASARPLVPAQLPFVGREAEVRELEAAWSRGGLIWIEGEAGVGKSRLATDFCAAHGAFALARCRSGDGQVAYAAFTRALRVLAADAVQAAGLPPWVAGEMARVLPELGPQPRPLASADEQARFFEACAQAWQCLGDGSFDAIVIDDWHHADASSQALLAYIAQAAGGASARLLLLARPLVPRPPLADAATSVLVLAPLPHDAVTDLVRQLSRVVDPTRFASRLQRATGGNPFFIAETLRHLVETGALHSNAHGRWATAFDDDTADYRELPLPATVRDAVLARVQRLADAPRRLLEAASVATEPFEPALLAAACALSELEALAAIEQALAAHLLREHQHGGYAFDHDLAQQTLEGALTPARRRLAHRRLALAAEATRAAPGLIAHHFEAGGEPARAVPLRLAAGDEAQRLFAGAQALVHWRAGLADGAAPAQALQLHLRCARALIDLGEGDAALAHAAQAQALASDGAVDDEQRAAALTACADIDATLSRAQDALQCVDRLLESLPTGAARARALRVRCHALQNLGRLDEAQAAAQQALLLWPDNPLERAELLDMLQLIDYQRGKVRDALALARDAASLWLLHGDRRSIAKAHYRVGVLLLATGDVDQGASELAISRRMAAEMHLVEQERDVILNLMKIEADRGDAHAMLALADEGWHLSPTFARARIRQIFLQAQCHANGMLGNLGRCVEIAEQFLAESAHNPEPVARQYAVLTMLDLLVYLGDFERGRALLQEVAAARTAELAYLGIKLAFARVFLELRAGEFAAARQALADVGDAAALQQPQDQASYALRHAELLLAEGDAHGAMAALEGWRAAVPNVELAALIWAARLQAQRAAGCVDAGDWQAARAALAAGKLPPTDALELQRALHASALRDADRVELARELRSAVERLADSLGARPDLKAAFLARNGG